MLREVLVNITDLIKVRTRTMAAAPVAKSGCSHAFFVVVLVVVVLVFVFFSLETI